MLWARRIIYPLMLFFYAVNSYAQDTYFDFSIEKPFVESGSEFDVNFKYELEGFEDKDFLVNPVVNRGLVSYRYNKLSSVYPISLIGFGNISLSFDIWNLVTGEIYKTPAKSIWSTLVYSKYIEKLNTNLKAFVDAKIDR